LAEIFLDIVGVTNFMFDIDMISCKSHYICNKMQEHRQYGVIKKSIYLLNYKQHLSFRWKSN